MAVQALKVRVEPAAPAAKVAPLPKPDPPPRSRRLIVGECFCIREILFRRLLRQKCELSVEPAQLSRSPPSLLNAFALRRSDRVNTICVYRAMRRSRPAAPRMEPRLQQEELSHPSCRCQATGHMRRRGLGRRRLRESERSKSE